MAEKAPYQEEDHKTLVFCTAYARTRQIWASRYRVWLDNLIDSDLRHTQIIMVDDASPVLPDWQDVRIVASFEEIREEDRYVIVSFPTHRGRVDSVNSEGWYRSFSSAIRYANERRFRKVVHLESDAYLISRRAYDFVNHHEAGWSTFWCSRHDFPEIQIQVISGTDLSLADAFFSKDYSHIRGRLHELVLPFNDIRREFVGERYQEFEEYAPFNADWATQVSYTKSFDNIWWLNSRNPSYMNIVEGSSNPCFKSGWSLPENHFVWSLGHGSAIELYAPRHAGDAYLYLDVEPLVAVASIHYQSVGISIDGLPIGKIAVKQRTQVRLHIPSYVLRHADKVLLEMHYSNPLSPHDVDPSNSDTRKLAIGLRAANIVVIE